jgi:hypothetical protein
MLLVRVQPGEQEFNPPCQTPSSPKWTVTAEQLRQSTGAVTILVSHRFSTVRMADLIVVLDRSRVIDCSG